jgi:hypothetical protein
MTTMYDDRNLTEQSLDELTLGAELGHVARSFLIKNTESILACARVIHKAYDLYYAPRAKRGKPHKGTLFAKRQDELEKQWNAFLEASGFQMPQHHKLLRQYWTIGKREPLLRKYSENLPNSVDGIVALCEKDVTPEEFSLVIGECSPSTTAAEIRRLILLSRTLPDELDNEITIPDFIEGLSDPPDVVAAITKLKDQEAKQSEAAFPVKQQLFKKAIQEDQTGSICLFAMPAVEVTHENLAEVALAILVLKKLKLYRVPEIGLEMEFGKQFAEVAALLERQIMWRASVVYGLDKLESQAKLAQQAIRLDQENALLQAKAA